MKISVLRAFLLKGERQEIGTVVEVAASLAAELIHNRRAERAGDAPAAPPGPMTTASVPELVTGAAVAKRGNKHD